MTIANFLPEMGKGKYLGVEMNGCKLGIDKLKTLKHLEYFAPLLL